MYVPTVQECVMPYWVKCGTPHDSLILMSSCTQTQNNNTHHSWNEEQIRKLVQEKFGKWACSFQIRMAKALYEGKDVVGISPTSSRKTLSFWIPLLMAHADGLHDKMSFVVTPLNLLGKQNKQELNAASLPAVAVSRENTNEQTFKVQVPVVCLIPILITYG